MPDEIHEAAVQAAAEVLARNDLAGGDPQLYHADARAVLAAALPHLAGQRVVLIKPGDRLIIGGVRIDDHTSESLGELASMLHEAGFGAVAFTEADASIAADHNAAIAERHTELRDAVSRLLGFDVAMPTQVLIEQLARE